MFLGVSLKESSGTPITGSIIFNNGKAEFNFSNGLISIPDAASKTILIYAQLDPTKAVTGTSVRLGINNASDITAQGTCDGSINTGVSINGTAMGNYMTMGQ
jgi:hypothetical protein